MLDLINNAKQSIEIIMFVWLWYKEDFSCDMSLINHALIRAQRRGVKLRAIVNFGGAVAVLKEQGIDVRTNDPGTLLHSKMVIVDSAVLAMGSHNFTENAMNSNIETSMLIEDTEQAKKMKLYFDSLWLS